MCRIAFNQVFYVFTFATDDFLLSPQPLTVLVGENATFDCVGEEETMGYQWIAYDNDGMVMSITNISIPEDHFFSSQTYTNVGLHGIHKVQCVLIVNDTVIFSEKVTLEVVGRYFNIYSIYVIL